MFLKYRNILALTLLFSVFSTCVEHTRSASVWNNGRFEAPLRDLETIRKEGRLRVVVDYNFTNYFVYRGKPMGFKYEILKQIAKDLEVKLEFIVSNDLEETFRGLESGRFDLAAKNLTVTAERSQRVDFLYPMAKTRQLLVQRQRQEGNNEFSDYVHEKKALAGKTVIVQKNSAFVNSLQSIGDEIGSGVTVVEDSVAGVEQLVSMVSSGEIDFTVCDEYVAALYATHYRNLDISVPVGDGLDDIAWAVRKDTRSLKIFLDQWLKEYTASNAYRQLQAKYFTSVRSFSRARSAYHSTQHGRISPYDEIIKKEAALKGWDWRLIAAVIFQESQFDTIATSWAGAAGLMQLMPETAVSLGVTDVTDPQENIRAGIRLLSWLDSQLKSEISDDAERLKFVLASYNVGLGHVMDARKLAGKYGRNPFRWKDNVDYFVLNKSMAKYYNDPVVKWGYARGSEPYEFVSSVLSHYGHYCNVIPE